MLRHEGLIAGIRSEQWLRSEQIACQQDGKLWTDAAASTTPPDLARAYNETLARMIGGQVSPHKGMSVTTNGKSGPRIDLLLPEHAQGWATAIRDLLAGIERQNREAA